MFDPSKHTIKIRGGAEYLPVAFRIVWFRESHPDWSLVTEAVEVDHERAFAIFRCSVMNEDGRIIATATKMEDRKGFGDWLEKAETGSIGRALALCGFGAALAPEMDEGERLADSPIDSPPDPRHALLDALKAEAERLELHDQIGDGSIKELSRLTRTVAVWSGREVGKTVSPEDISFAVKELGAWKTGQMPQADEGEIL